MSLDIESFRTANGLTYGRLRKLLNLDLSPSHVRRIALGKMWPRPQIIDRIIQASGGQITVDAMHKRYSASHSDDGPEAEPEFAAAQPRIDVPERRDDVRKDG